MKERGKKVVVPAGRAKSEGFTHEQYHGRNKERMTEHTGPGDPRRLVPTRLKPELFNLGNELIQFSMSVNFRNSGQIGEFRQFRRELSADRFNPKRFIYPGYHFKLADGGVLVRGAHDPPGSIPVFIS